MEKLPPEIVLQVIRFLEAPEVVNLQFVCRRLHIISRDENLWKSRCFETSSWESLRRRRELLRLRLGREMSENMADTNSDQPRLEEIPTQDTLKSPLASERIRLLANWDPSYPGEKVDWYADYIHRNAPIAVSWVQQPRNLGGRGPELMDVRGSGVYNPPGDDETSVAVAPLDDGSLCLWDLSGSSGQKGRIMARSPAGTLSPSPGISGSGQPFPRTITIGATECISVDSARKKAYIAVQCDLLEVDLETLQVVSQEKFPYPISVLSDSKGTTPITVGTSRTLHINDPRTNSPNGNPKDAASSLHPPVSIINVPSQDTGGGDGDIYVAGRFPSILNYDRRWFPRLRRTIYSGGRLCSLALIPSYPLACAEDRDRIRQGEFSIQQMDTIKSQEGHTLIAAGEYNSKGSLEFYGLDVQPRPRSSIPVYSFSTDKLHALKNRQTSSGAKLLSVSNHGALIVFSDGRGCLKWFERDGVTGVREWNVSHGRREATLGIFGVLGDSYLNSSSGEIVRKISHTHSRENAPKTSEDDLVLWTGEKLGVLSFSSKPGYTAESFEEAAKTAEEAHREREERIHSETMRRALERQADEVRFISGLGLGMRGDM